MLCINILKAGGEIDDEEWFFLLTGGIAIGNPDSNPYHWLPDKSWDEICRLSVLKSFTDLRGSLQELESGFHALFDSLVWMSFFYLFNFLLFIIKQQQF